MLETAFTKALNVVLLQRHQNVGELRLHAPNVLKSVRNCRVTRMLVSYDLFRLRKIESKKLQGHQNVGELRLTGNTSYSLKAIVGSPECW